MVQCLVLKFGRIGYTEEEWMGDHGMGVTGYEKLEDICCDGQRHYVK